MKTSLIALALLVGASAQVEARGLHIKSSGHSGGGTHGSSTHSSGTHDSASGSGGIHLPSVRPRAGSSSAAAAANTEPAAAGTDQRAATTDKLNAELAAMRAATPPAAPVGTLRATQAAETAPLAANEHRLTRPVTTGKVQAEATGAPIDITHLVAKDSALKDTGGTARGDLVDRRGVNCSLYPARCR